MKGKKTRHGMRWGKIALSRVTLYRSQFCNGIPKKDKAVFPEIDTRFLSPKDNLVECVRLFRETGSGDRESPHAGDQMQGMFWWVDGSA